MKKREFISLVSMQTGLTKRDSERAMDAIFRNLRLLLSQGDRLVVRDFGTFAVKDRAPRTARNPQTGQTIPVRASRAMAFRPAKILKDQIAAGKRGNANHDTKKEETL